MVAPVFDMIERTPLHLLGCFGSLCCWWLVCHAGILFQRTCL